MEASGFSHMVVYLFLGKDGQNVEIPESLWGSPPEKMFCRAGQLGWGAILNIVGMQSELE
jgi:hypothetical protein